MEYARGEAEVRGAISAAAAIVGVPVELHEGADWWVRDGVAHVGLQRVADEGYSSDDAVASVMLLLWESVREVRLAPARRHRRIALGRSRPETEPLLAAIDRLLAAAELLAAMPSLRLPLSRVLRGQTARAISAPGELPRHLQWVVAVLDTAALRWAAGQTATPGYLTSLAPEVQRELAALDGLGSGGLGSGGLGSVGLSSGDLSASGAGAGGARALLLSLSADPKRSPMRRFERAYGLLAPPFDRLLALDASERGLQREGDQRDGDQSDRDNRDDAGFDAGGADASDDPGSAGDGGEATSDGDTEPARAGDKRESAEGADLFAAEQAGFVQTVLATPLPASGAWVAGLDLPDAVASPDPDDSQDASRDPGALGVGSAGATALESYRERVREHAASIDQVRDVWRQIVSERVREERTFSRLPEADGEMLDRRSLVRTVAEVTAGVERPRAFLTRQRRPRKSRREGSTDYVLLIDRSASMQGAPAQAAATAALILLEALAGVERDIAAEERALGIDLELSLRTALIVFDSAAHVVKPLAGALDDQARRMLDAAIHSPQGSTNDAAALRAAARELGVGRSSGSGVDPERAAARASTRFPHASSGGVARRRVVILVSDGGTNDAPAAAAELAALRSAGATVLGIGIRTDDLVARFAPDGIRLDAAAELPRVLQRLVTGAGLTE